MAGSVWQVQPASLTPAHCIGIAAIVVFVSLLYRYSSPQMDPREPRFVAPGIPLVGHIVGLVRHGVDYFEVIRYYCPIITMPAQLPSDAAAD
jgi:hypothetical protein